MTKDSEEANSEEAKRAFFNTLIQACANEFAQAYPNADKDLMVNSMGSIMFVMHEAQAPIELLEFREALRNCANILEIIYNEKSTN